MIPAYHPPVLNGMHLVVVVAWVYLAKAQMAQAERQAPPQVVAVVAQGVLAQAVRKAGALA
jgi:hypothetical protein